MRIRLYWNLLLSVVRSMQMSDKAYLAQTAACSRKKVHLVVFHGHLEWHSTASAGKRMLLVVVVVVVVVVAAVVADRGDR